MSYIETHSLEHSTIHSIYSEWDEIVKDPPYQRNGEIWSLDKQQLLIDSIINRYDLPKIYFHKYDRSEVRKTGKAYAIIDGRQRLETIVSFIEDGFPLADKFEYLQDAKVKPAGMSYSELAKQYPKLKSRFDSFSLPIVTVETDDLELIDEMFSRLNEAVPLNAAEKRRAIGGDMVKAIDAIASHPFFTRKVRFSNKRYQHKEAAVRLLFLSYNQENNRIIDTKKPYLDQFTKDFKSGKSKTVNRLKENIKSLLNSLVSAFTDNDPLLQSQAIIPIYAFVFARLIKQGKEDKFRRTRLLKFNEQRNENKAIAEEDITKARFELLEFDRLSLQGTNDANSIRERWRILEDWLDGAHNE